MNFLEKYSNYECEIKNEAVILLRRRYTVICCIRLTMVCNIPNLRTADHVTFNRLQIKVDRHNVFMKFNGKYT